MSYEMTKEVNLRTSALFPINGLYFDASTLPQNKKKKREPQHAHLSYK
jgi:hypothetical protein